MWTRLRRDGEGRIGKRAINRGWMVKKDGDEGGWEKKLYGIKQREGKSEIVLELGNGVGVFLLVEYKSKGINRILIIYIRFGSV